VKWSHGGWIVVLCERLNEEMNEGGKAGKGSTKLGGPDGDGLDVFSSNTYEAPLSRLCESLWRLREGLKG